MGCQRVLPDVLPEGDVVEAQHHLHLDPLPRQVSLARAFLREHVPPLPDDAMETLLLLTSELVTNAVLHARTAIELGLTVTQNWLLVAVHDEDLTRPEQRPYDGREGGWGLSLVAALASDSGMALHQGDGKSAWFLLPRADAPHPDDGAAARPAPADERPVTG